MHNHGRHPHLTALTGLRGIAAIGIVLHHYTAYLFPATGEYIRQITPFLLKNYLWVDFFFILSGFVLAHVYQKTFARQIKRRAYFTFLRARLARIYPLHIITLLFLVGLEIIRLYLFHTYGIGDLQHPPFTGKQSIESFFTNLFLLQALHEWSYWNEPAWAISAEWLLYLVVPLFLFLYKYSNRCIDIGIFFFGFTALYLLAAHNNGLDFASWRSLIRCSAEVTLGILTYKLTYRQVLGQIFNSSWITSLLLVGILTSMAMTINHVVTVFLFVLLIASAAQLPSHTLLTNPSFVFLGKISYSIYMTHWLLIKILSTVSFALTGTDFHNQITPVYQFLALPVIIGILLLISTATFYRIEQPLRSRIINLQLTSYTKSKP